MLSLDHVAAIVGALNTVTDPDLCSLLTDRVHDWTAMGLLDLTHVLIVEPRDTEEAVSEAIGFSPLANPEDGVRYNADGYHFPWDWAEEHGTWLELMMTIGNDGYALFLLVAQGAGLASELRSMCRAHAAQ